MRCVPLTPRRASLKAFRPVLRQTLERRQLPIYFSAVLLAASVALLTPQAARLDAAVTPALALMMFTTFLQLPLVRLRAAFTPMRSLVALLAANFVLVPVLVGALVQFAPAQNPIIRLGVLLVLLAPCVDYVVTFSRLGRGNAELMLAATPLLLLAQMLLLPLFLALFMDERLHAVLQFRPFLEAFVWLIALPLVLARVVQLWAARTAVGATVSEALQCWTVPATAIVLFVVIASVVPRLGEAAQAALAVLPIYAAFAATAPFIGWFVARVFRLDAAAARTVAFSAATRNSLVVLPLAYAVPDAVPLLPAIIVTQTLVELTSELIYIRVLPRIGERAS